MTQSKPTFSTPYEFDLNPFLPKFSSLSPNNFSSEEMDKRMIFKVRYDTDVLTYVKSISNLLLSQKIPIVHVKAAGYGINNLQKITSVLSERFYDIHKLNYFSFEECLSCNKIEDENMSKTYYPYAKSRLSEASF